MNPPKKPVQLAPSILSANFSCLQPDIDAVIAGGADLIHIDVMDGHFVPNITMGPLVVKALRKITTIPLDVHLMIETPERFIDDFANAGADLITVHPEATAHLHRVIQTIKEKGIKAGVALNPATPLSTLSWLWQDLDLVLLMSVNPGFGGQQFIPSALEKLSRLKQLVDQENPHILIEIDGGVKLSNLVTIARTGANIIVAGSGIFHTPNPTETTRKMKQLVAAI